MYVLLWRRSSKAPQRTLMLTDLIKLWTNQGVIEYVSTRGAHCVITFDPWRSSQPNQDCFIKKSKVRK